MNILICRWDIFVYPDILDTLKNEGHRFDVLDFSAIKMSDDEISGFSRLLENKISAACYDAVFSINYFSYIAELCHKINLHYICYNVDSPLLNMQHPSVAYETNCIYTFDSNEAKYFNNDGIDTVHYLPLCTNTERVQALMKNKLSSKSVSGFCNLKNPSLTDSKKTSIKTTNLKHIENDETNLFYKYIYDISFVGNLYDKNRYDEMEHILPDYLCGYMDAAIEAQLNVSGGNLLKNMLTPEIVDMLSEYTDVKASAQSYADLKFHFATSVLSHKAAAKMRTVTLNRLAMRYPDKVHLFTTSDTTSLFPGLVIHEAVDYLLEAPLVFAKSKININMTAPNIETGIPLRVFDILGAGGFVLTDWREDLKDCFTIGKDLEVYDGIDDLLEKTDYYLKHEDKREMIAKHGLETVQNRHNYSVRMRKIFKKLLPHFI